MLLLCTNSNGNVFAIRSYNQLNLKDLFIFRCLDAIWKNENGTCQKINVPIHCPGMILVILQ